MNEYIKKEEGSLVPIILKMKHVTENQCLFAFFLWCRLYVGSTGRKQLGAI